MARRQVGPSGLQVHGFLVPLQDVQLGPVDRQLQLGLFDGQQLAPNFELRDESRLEKVFSAGKHCLGRLEARVRFRDVAQASLQFGDVLSLFVSLEGDLGRGQVRRGLGEAGPGLVDICLGETEVLLEFLCVQANKVVAGLDDGSAGDHPGDRVGTADLRFDFGVFAACQGTLFGNGDQQVAASDLVGQGRFVSLRGEQGGLKGHGGRGNDNHTESQHEQHPRAILRSLLRTTHRL